MEGTCSVGRVKQTTHKLTKTREVGDLQMGI